MPLKLSEAIRLGAMLRPQAFGTYFSDGGSCAIAAAMEALGIASYSRDHGTLFDSHRSLAKRYPMLSKLRVVPPVDVNTDAPNVSNVIVRLNNDHYWTREQIADWIEQIERLQEPTSQPASRDLISSLKS